MADQYSVLVQVVTLGPNAEDATDAELQRELSVGLLQQVGGLEEATSKFQGGGWQIVSHDVTPIGRRLLTTFLLHRPKP